MLSIQSEADFKALPRLRWKVDVDGSVIAKSRRLRLRKDFLYFQGPGVLGIYYERDSVRAASLALSWWRTQISGEITQELPCDWDGIIQFRPKEIGDIPGVFFKSANLGYHSRFKKGHAVGRRSASRLNDPTPAGT